MFMRGALAFYTGAPNLIRIKDAKTKQCRQRKNIACMQLTPKSRRFLSFMYIGFIDFISDCVNDQFADTKENSNTKKTSTKEQEHLLPGNSVSYSNYEKD